MRALLFLVAIATSVHAGTAPVVGGSTVPEGEWPDTVAVIGKTGTCSGTLIAPTVVLTAGHCSENQAQQVIANTTDYAAQGGAHANVQSITAYPEWDATYDVSVIVLAKPITTVRPRLVATACTYDEFAKGTDVRLVGFGLTDAAGAGANTRLHEAMTTVVDPDCSHGNGCRTIGGEFTAGGDGVDSCFGDSGGPVELDTDRGPVLVGIVSRGMNGSLTACGGGGIYVRTDHVIAWIEATAGVAIAKDNCVMQPSGDSSGAVDSTTPSDNVDVDTVTGGCAASTEPNGLLLVLFALSGFVRRKPD